MIGLVDMAIVPRLNFLAPQAWIPDLVVTRGARGRGAGAALLVRAEEAARERGAWAVRLESANWRARAHAFYLREGYSDDAKSFDKALAELGWAPPTGPEELNAPGHPGAVIAARSRSPFAAIRPRSPARGIHGRWSSSKR
ncbi:MAG TPA: GNAT family N-acetyltransferase [Actinomycetota bacterium]|nr:GNAT family N-acetyltransferase [Actinomycetota bacterium]